MPFFLPGVPQVYYVGALAGSNDMELLMRTNVGRDINRHYNTTAEIDANLERPVVRALNVLAKFRNELPAFDGGFNYAVDGETSALAGSNDMELLKRTNVGRDINRHYYTTAEIDANLERPVVRALNALATFRNELPAFNGDFDYAVDGGAISFTWNDGSTSATLRFTPSLGMGVDNARSVAALTWTDAGGEHHSDDLIANPPVAHMD